jgi:2-polyprenyl-6-methoxyphenol hydroxylase-like FAD-dependent oxidoreductase
MAIDFAFRKSAVQTLTNSIGVYVLCDLDGVPIYVGQSKDGIRARVRRHLTSARSDIIANRQIDVWEIAWVMAFPESDRNSLNELESRVFHYFNDRSTLMNGTIPIRLANESEPPAPAQLIQVMADAEIAEKLEASLRLPRQAEHYSQIVSHFLSVKNSTQIARAMQAHFERLSKYHRQLLGLATADEDSREI